MRHFKSGLSDIFWTSFLQSLETTGILRTDKRLDDLMKNLKQLKKEQQVSTIEQLKLGRTAFRRYIVLDSIGTGSGSALCIFFQCCELLHEVAFKSFQGTTGDSRIWIAVQGNNRYLRQLQKQRQWTGEGLVIRIKL